MCILGSIYPKKFKRAQAMAELAIMLSIFLGFLGLLVSYGIKMNAQQHRQMQSFRHSVASASTDNVTATYKTYSAEYRKDESVPDVSSQYGASSLSSSKGQARVTRSYFLNQPIDGNSLENINAALPRQHFIINGKEIAPDKSILDEVKVKDEKGKEYVLPGFTTKGGAEGVSFETVDYSYKGYEEYPFFKIIILVEDVDDSLPPSGGGDDIYWSWLEIVVDSIVPYQDEEYPEFSGLHTAGTIEDILEGDNDEDGDGNPDWLEDNWSPGGGGKNGIPDGEELPDDIVIGTDISGNPIYDDDVDGDGISDEEEDYIGTHGVVYDLGPMLDREIELGKGDLYPAVEEEFILQQGRNLHYSCLTGIDSSYDSTFVILDSSGSAGGDNPEMKVMNSGLAQVNYENVTDTARHKSLEGLRSYRKVETDVDEYKLENRISPDDGTYGTKTMRDYEETVTRKIETSGGTQEVESTRDINSETYDWSGGEE